MQRSLVAFLSLLLATAAVAQHPRPGTPNVGSAVAMERYEGTSVVTELGFGVTLNKSSTLRREWFVVRDDAAPVTVAGAAGISVIYKSGERGIGGQYQYKIPYRVVAREPVTAFELRAVVIDVFGRLVKESLQNPVPIRVVAAGVM